jgi:hypothetical protein
MGGRIRATNGTDGGARFTIRLPGAPGAAEERSDEEHTVPEARETP